MNNFMFRLKYDQTRRLYPEHANKPIYLPIYTSRGLLEGYFPTLAFTIFALTITLLGASRQPQ